MIIPLAYIDVYYGATTEHRGDAVTVDLAAGTDHGLVLVVGVGGGRIAELVGAGGDEPADDGADPSVEDLHVEGFGQVVVGSGLESLDDVDGIGAGGDDDDRDRRALTHGTADGGAVHRRQHEVEEEDVGAVGGDEFVSLAAVGEGRDRVIEAFEPDLGRFPDDLVILDQNNMHYVSPFSRVKR